jgi:hypothetical protein
LNSSFRHKGKCVAGGQDPVESAFPPAITCHLKQNRIRK